ncbi:type I 3-dehydroquinate dehydratase [Candidatus Micrarchaeota archaeon]|nr:type I 3-dehydroquinate dehydratase [Candidatus Micrarchaeota archaeon]
MKGKIYVSIAEKTLQECIRALEGLSFAEVRIDALEGKPSAQEIREIFSQPVSLIATCRAGKFSQQEREEMLLLAIEAGAKFVDVELESGREAVQKIAQKAHAHSCKAIVSHHDFEKTPSSEELEGIVSRCFEAGADIAKVACKVNEQEDNARLLGLLGEGRKIIVIGMGSKGKITRVVAPLLGSEFTFASAGKGKETADGQMEKEEMGKIMREMGALI